MYVYKNKYQSINQKPPNQMQVKTKDKILRILMQLIKRKERKRRERREDGIKKTKKRRG